jgi:membrane-associated phospholipid phosphatase
MHLFRRSELVIIGYFTYAAVLAQFLPLRRPIPAVTMLLNLTIITGYFLLAHAHSLRRRHFLGIIRDWFPWPLLVMAYREMGWFAPASHSYSLERTWVQWDRFFLNTLGVRTAIESLGPLFPSVLEISYPLVYTIPYFAVAMIFVYRRREYLEAFAFPFVLSVLLCYVLFPCFPSEPPRTVFPGEDLPPWNRVFRQLNLWMLGSYGIHTSVFPSAHVAAGFAAALSIRKAMPETKWVARTILVLAFLIATATVYGRYHYLADAVAGLGVSVCCYWLTRGRWRADGLTSCR